MGGRFQYWKSGLKYFTNTLLFAKDFESEIFSTARPFHILKGDIPVEQLL